MGVDSRHPAIGRDLTLPQFYHGGGRAQLQFHDLQGWLVDGKVVIMQPKLPMQSYLCMNIDARQQVYRRPPSDVRTTRG